MEEKSIKIDLVAASERARAQIRAVLSRHALPPGGCGVSLESCVEDSFRACGYQKGLERPAIEGDSPVGEMRGVWNGGDSRVPSDTWNPMGSWEDHLPRLNTCRNPIVNQYREGKVKRTPGGE